MRFLRGMAQSVARFWNRHPGWSGVLLGVILIGGWMVLFGEPPPLSDGWMLVVLGGVTMLVAIVARAGSNQDDEW